MKSPLVFAWVLTLLAVFSLSGESFVQGDATDLTGVYACEGTGPDNVGYHGTVQIIRHDHTYEVQWDLSSAEQYLGVGLVTGDVLAVSYFGGVPGVVVYKIEQGENGPRLVGQWAVAEAAGRVFAETLTRLTTEVTDPLPARPRPSRTLRPNGSSV